MVNKIWIFFIISGIVYAIFTNNIVLVNEEILKSANNAFEMVTKIFPTIALWLGIMKIASNSGLLNELSKKLSKVLRIFFKDIPEGHESLSYIASNIICNICGLSSSATPFGLKAMSSMQKLNKDKKVVTKSMITFLVINTTGFTIIPTTIISLRMMHKSTSSSIIVLPCLLATLGTTLIGLLLNYIFGRRN